MKMERQECKCTVNVQPQEPTDEAGFAVCIKTIYSRIADVGDSHLKLTWGTKGCAFIHLCFEGSVDFFICVPNNCRAPATNIVNVFVAIDIVAFAAFNAFKNDWLASNGLERTYRRVDSAGEKRLCFLEDLQYS